MRQDSQGRFVFHQSRPTRRRWSAPTDADQGSRALSLAFVENARRRGAEPAFRGEDEKQLPRGEPASSHLPTDLTFTAAGNLYATHGCTRLRLAALRH